MTGQEDRMEDKRTRMDQGGPDDLITQHHADWSSLGAGGLVSHAGVTRSGQLNQLAQPDAMIGGVRFR
jgi:hypothetical protein